MLTFENVLTVFVITCGKTRRKKSSHAGAATFG